MNKEGKARSKAKAKATAKLDKELEQIKRQQQYLAEQEAKLEADARNTLTTKQPVKRTSTNSADMLDPQTNTSTNSDSTARNGNRSKIINRNR